MAGQYTLGRGILYLTPIVGGVAGTEYDVGNAPELNFNIDIETLEHFSSRSKLKSKDLEVILQVSPKVNFVLEDMKPENLSLAFLGTSTVVGDVTTINIADEPNTMVALRYVSDNPIGPAFEFNAWTVMLKPEGDIALIGADEISKLGFTGEILADEAGNPTKPFGTLEVDVS